MGDGNKTVDPPVKSFGQKGAANIGGTLIQAPPIDVNDHINPKGRTEYSDPFFSGGDFNQDARSNIMEAGQDAVQKWYGKLGNGVMKMTGSFANGILSTAGTIYGAAVSPFTLLAGGDSHLWDNPFSKMGDDISTLVNENFTNYQSLGEKNASAWSPDYWKTMNFFSDNILGNVGFAAAAYLSGSGISKVLGGLAPFIAGKNLKAGLDIMAKEGVEGLLAPNIAKAYTAVNRWDRASQALSIGIAASGEASTEAIQTYRETVKNLTASAADKYGGKENIPQSVLDGIEKDAHSAGNIDYMINIPVLAGADMIQWGRNMSPFKSELKALEQHPIQLEQAIAGKEGLLGAYKQVEKTVPKTGSVDWFGTKAKALAHTLKDNISEAGQEGVQYIAQQGSENWYQRKNDPDAWNAVNDFMDPYLKAAQQLVTTQEGVANILGGFAGAAPFTVSRFIHDKMNRKSDATINQEALNHINSPFGQSTIKDNLKTYFENMARHNSAQTDLQNAMARGDEHGARNAKFDQMKAYINSRIQTGRIDLLNNELEQMRQLSDEEFKTFFNIDPSLSLNKTTVLDNFKNTAEDMHRTYQQMDRLFNPDMYRIDKLPEDEQQKKLQELGEYKSQLWNYMMDFKDREKRSVELNKEVTDAFNNALPYSSLIDNKFDNEAMDDLYKQYVATAADHAINSEYNPLYKDSAKEREVVNLRNRLKNKIKEIGGEKIDERAVGIDAMMDKKDYVENYLFNVDKQIMPILRDPKVQAAMGVHDINSVITKMYDLAQLHVERRLAINSYNQLASMIKTGEYLSDEVRNPAYDAEKHKNIPEYITKTIDGEQVPVKNPEYVPEKIPSEEMLNYNGYAQNKNERDDYYRQLRIDQEKNKAEQDAFRETLKDATAITPTEESKPYHDRVAEYLNGSKNIQPLRTMSDRQLEIYRAFAQRSIDEASHKGTFDISTKKARNGFNLESYIDVNARLTAANTEEARRKRNKTNDIQKKADALVKYVYANKIDPEALQPGFKAENVTQSDAVIAKAKETLAQHERQRQQEQERKNAEIVAAEEDKVRQLAEENSLVSDNTLKAVRDNTIKTATKNKLIKQLVAKIVAGEPLTPNETEVMLKYEDVISEQAKAQGAAEFAGSAQPVTYVQPEPIILPGSRQSDIIQAGIAAGVKAANDETNKISVEGESFFRLMRSDLETIYENGKHENAYSEDGNVQVNHNQFKSAKFFTDPRNPLNFNNRPKLRYKYISDNNYGKVQEPRIELQASPDGGKTWVETGYLMEGLYNYRTGEPRTYKFHPDAAINKQKSEAFVNLIKDTTAKAKEKGFVEVELRGDVSYGHVIENKEGENGREPKGLTEISNELNNIAKSDAPFLAVINGSDIVYRDPASRDNRLTNVNDRTGVFVRTANLNAVINAVPRNGVKVKADRDGQFALFLPTGKMQDSRYEYFPVLLSGKLLNDHTTDKYDIGQGLGIPHNMGQILMDALLNPHKSEYSDLFKSMFDMVGLPGEYKGLETDWKKFYTDKNIYSLVNQVFFAAGKTIDAPEDYKIPFKVAVVQSDKAIKIRIGINDETEKDAREVDILVSKDGKNLETSGIDQRIADEYKYREKHPELKIRGTKIAYKDIQGQIADKAYHVQVGEMSKKLSTAEAYTGFVFDKDGKLTTQKFQSYFHWVDHLGLAGATVQSIKDDAGNQQWFVNQRVYLQPVLSETKVTTSKAASEQDVQMGDVGGVIIPEKTKFTKPKGAKVQTADANTTIGQAIVTGNSADETIPASSVTLNQDIQLINDASADMDRNKKKRKGKGTAMFNPNYRNISQRSLSTVANYKQEAITDELASMLLTEMLDRREKGAISTQQLKDILFNKVQERIYSLIKQARPSLNDVSIDQWEDMPAENPDGSYLRPDEIAKLPADAQSQYNHLLFANRFDDIDRFIQMDKDGELPDSFRNMITMSNREVGFENGKPIYEPEYFVGFLNRAVARVAELNIVQAFNKGDLVVDLNKEEGTDYTQRFDDAWALQVNPKSTLLFQSKIILNTVPEISTLIDNDGNVTYANTKTVTGFQKNIKYDTLFSQVLELGQNSRIEDFEYNLINNPAYDISPAIKALRVKLQGIKDNNKEQYDQIIKQLAQTATALRQNGVIRIDYDMDDQGYSAEHTIYSSAKQKITDQVAQAWQSQLSLKLATSNYITPTEVKDDNGLLTTKYTISKTVPVTYRDSKGKMQTVNTDFVDAFKKQIDNIFTDYKLSDGKAASFDGYVKLARLIKDTTGMELVEGDFKDPGTAGFQTAKVFQSLNNVTKPNAFDKSNLAYYMKKDGINFKTLFTQTMGNNILMQIRKAVNEEKYNPDEPFKNSSGALDVFAQLFKAYHPSMFSSQAKNIKGENEYTLVTADFMKHNMDKLQDEMYLRQLKQLPLLKDDYFLNKQFTFNEISQEFEYKPTEAWRKMHADFVTGMKRRKSRSRRAIVEARKATGSVVDLMSMMLYQNEEVASKEHRGEALYFIPGGDSSAATVINFQKTAFPFEYNDNNFTLKDDGPDGAKAQLYSLFKNEVNRAATAFERFNRINEDSSLTLEQKKAALDEGYHYVQDGNVLKPGSAMRIYYFGKEQNSISESSSLYDTTPDGDALRPAGIKEELFKDGVIDDEKLKGVFDGFINDYLTAVINQKFEQMKPYKDSLFTVKEPDAFGDHYLTPRYTSRLFHINYVRSMKTLFDDKAIINGNKLGDYFASENGVTENSVLYANADDALNNGYHEQLYKTMVIDQQINHLIFLTQLMQKTWDVADFDPSLNWEKAVTDNTKRLKGLYSPFLRTPDKSNVYSLVYNDVEFGHHLIEKADVKLNVLHEETIAFMAAHGMESYVADNKIPAEYENLNTIYHMQKSIGTPVAKIASILKDALRSKVTDGGSIVTLREYLYQEWAQGRIRTGEFKSLYTKYMDPELKMTTADLKVLGLEPATAKLKVKKMAAIGNKVDNDRLTSVYVKDGKSVMIPAIVKGTRLEAVMNRLHELEGSDLNPSPGYQLLPVTAVKIGNPKVISRLYDENGNPNMDEINTAVPFVHPRDISGEQVQNPDKKSSNVNVGVQIQGLAFVGIHDEDVFAEDKFSKPKSQFNMPQNVATEGALNINETHVPDRGTTKKEMQRNLVDIVRTARDKKMQEYIYRYGLDYSISDEWKRAAADAGFAGDWDGFQSHIDEMHSDTDPDKRAAASQLELRKNDITIRTMNKLMNDIKQQVYSKYGMDASQTIALDQVVVEGLDNDYEEYLKMPLTFTPGNKQYQSVFMAQIEAIAKAMPINGFGGIQASAYHHGKVEVKGDTGLKGYRLSADGKSFETAEIAIPWIFKDEKGNPLKYENYVDGEGKPLPGKISENLLHILSYRIPNTGLNMAGRFKVVKFLKPAYKDMILIPNILYSQMGTDLDFDKLYNYLYNYQVNEKTGAIEKIRSVVNLRQNDIKSVLTGKEVEDRAVRSILRKSDPAFTIHEARVSQAYAEFAQKLQQLDLQEEDDITLSDALNTESLSALKQLKAKLDNDGAFTSEAKAELQKQYNGVIKEYNSLNEWIQTYKKLHGFNLDKFLNDPANRTALYDVQTPAQLQNAYQDIYHNLMGDIKTLPAMLTPLTSQEALSTVEEKKYGGKSFAELKGNNLNLVGPNTEVFQINNRKLAAAGKSMVGILASQAKLYPLVQQAYVNLGLKVEGKDDHTIMDPIVFLDNEGNLPVDKGRFVRDKENLRDQSKVYYNNKMVFRLPGQDDIDIPNRLDRITDITGKHNVKAFIDSLLQGYLDMQKNPNVVYTNINPVTSNAAITMALLGYVEQLPAFIKQEILEDYTNAINDKKTGIIKGGDVRNVIHNYINDANLDPGVFDEILNQMEDDIPAALHKFLQEYNLGDAKFNNQRFFSENELERMITQRFGIEEQDREYATNQLHVLNMFLRLDKVGTQLFGLTQATNLESQGIRNMSLLGATEQRDNFNRLGNEPFSTPNLVGAERIGPYSKVNNPSAIQTIQSTSFVYLKNMLKIFEGKNSVFSDLSPMFTTLRNFTSKRIGAFNLNEKERININIVQYLLSNPKLYSQFTDIFSEEMRNDPDMMRKLVYTDSIENEKVIERSLARAIEKSKEQKDEDGVTYDIKYPILSQFKTSVKKDSNTPSWVYNFNTNAFKERIGQQLPHDVYLMLRDTNPAIQKIAKQMYLYYYLGGGITTPLSFGHLLDQGELFKRGGMGDIMREEFVGLNDKMKSLETEVKLSYHLFQQNLSADYPKPSWFRYIDPAIVKVNKEASTLLHSFYTQFIQNHPYDADKTGLKQDIHFENIADNAVRLIAEKKLPTVDSEQPYPEFMASFLDTNQNVYVINPDGETYTRLNRAGYRTFAEYNAAAQSSKSIMTGNRVRFETVKSLNTEEADGSEEQSTVIPEAAPLVNRSLPFELDKEASAMRLMDYYFTEQNISSTELSGDPTELAQLNLLGKEIAKLMPKSTTAIPYSVDKAKEIFKTWDGTITVNGQSAFGSFIPDGRESNGLIQLAFGFATKDKTDPLLFRKVLLHESTHATTRIMINLLSRVQEGKMSRSDIADLLQLPTKDADGTTRVKILNNALKAKGELDNMREFLNNNIKLQKEYIRNNGGEGNRVKSLEQLKVITSNTDEFVSYLFQDKGFRESLKAIAYGDKKTTFFDKIIDTIKKLLGLEPGTAAYHAFDNVFTMLEPLKSTESILQSGGAKSELAMRDLRELYKGVSNLNSEYMSEEELQIYDQLVKDGKIIC